MSKRSCPSEKVEQAIKKQKGHRNNEIKAREIRSTSSERTLQLLYKGAAKAHVVEGNTIKVNNNNNNGTIIAQAMLKPCCVAQLPAMKGACSYCNNNICLICGCCCFICNEKFCDKCSFPTYDERQTICYSCYK